MLGLPALKLDSIEIEFKDVKKTVSGIFTPLTLL